MLKRLFKITALLLVLATVPVSCSLKIEDTSKNEQNSDSEKDLKENDKENSKDEDSGKKDSSKDNTKTSAKIGSIIDEAEEEDTSSADSTEIRAASLTATYEKNCDFIKDGADYETVLSYLKQQDGKIVEKSDDHIEVVTTRFNDMNFTAVEIYDFKNGKISDYDFICFTKTNTEEYRKAVALNYADIALSYLMQDDFKFDSSTPSDTISKRKNTIVASNKMALNVEYGFKEDEGINYFEIYMKRL